MRVEPMPLPSATHLHRFALDGDLAGKEDQEMGTQYRNRASRP